MHAEPVVKDVVAYPSEHDLDLFIPVHGSVNATREFLLSRPQIPPPVTRTDYLLFPGDGSHIHDSGSIPDTINFLSRFFILYKFPANGRDRVNGEASEESKGQ